MYDTTETQGLVARRIGKDKKYENLALCLGVSVGAGDAGSPGGRRRSDEAHPAGDDGEGGGSGEDGDGGGGRGRDGGG